jgi:hypothetical protein
MAVQLMSRRAEGPEPPENMCVGVGGVGISPAGGTSSLLHPSLVRGPQETRARLEEGALLDHVLKCLEGAIAMMITTTTLSAATLATGSSYSDVDGCC